jgi:hypothetical protein
MGACVFQPDLTRFPACDAQGACPVGWTCLAPEGVCLPDCGERGPCSTETRLVLIPDGPKVGVETESYLHRFQASGGTPPYTFSIITGALPPGLSLNDQGELSGKPTTAGDFRFTLEVVDQGEMPQRASQELSLRIRPVLHVAGPYILATVQQGKAYVEQVSALGGKPPYRFELVSGSTLPPGLVLRDTGRVEGMTDTPTSLAFTVRVTDSDEPPQSVTRSLQILTGLCSFLCVTTQSVPDARRGSAYTYTLQAAGNTGSVLWKLESGALPPGLQLDSRTGLLSGTPDKAPGTYDFTVSAEDVLQTVSPVALSLKVL